VRTEQLPRAGLASVALLIPLGWTPPGRAADVGAVATTAPAASTAPSTNNNQATGFYLTGAAGAAWPGARSASNPYTTPVYTYTEHFAGGFSAEAGIGYDFGTVRTELTYNHESSTLLSRTDSDDPSEITNYTSGQMGVSGVLLSAYWDINTSSRWTPYIGGGVGYGWVSHSAYSDEGGWSSGAYGASAFAWQAKAGLSYSLTPKGDLFAEFIYRGLGGFNSKEGIRSFPYESLHRFGVQIGTRWRF
jgi:opacity protein-like surface antigen